MNLIEVKNITKSFNDLLVLNDISGSIHRVSAEILGKPSNNGWTYWFVERDNNLKSIDDLREEYAEKYITLGVNLSQKSKDDTKGMWLTMQYFLFTVNEQSWPEHFKTGIAAINDPSTDPNNKQGNAQKQKALCELASVNKEDILFFYFH